MRVDCDLGVPERSTAGLQQRRDRDPSIPRSSRWSVDLLEGAQEKCQLSARATGNLCCGRAVGAGGIPFFFLLFFFFSLLLTILDFPLYSLVLPLCVIIHHDFILTSSCNSSLCHVFAAFFVVICVGRFTHTQFGYLYDPRYFLFFSTCHT
ncbi:hypothetical protein BP00DRAFT_124945 [Aspergillus indologenus CBS 114.80]|uniref:Uncharacterized protein n=1 Tax=Aspergillus indologenus CBS 114.80 TaxID=1450541 RepID=A0A2V5I975_9EURO|nr:hypothetical protein BP00DRAFT_124945 [Aspergillus indologenus CBS 114.80]